MVKKLSPNAGDAGDARGAGSIPGSGRYPGVGNGNPLQYSCLQNSMGREPGWVIVYVVTQSRARLSMHTCSYVSLHVCIMCLSVCVCGGNESNSINQIFIIYLNQQDLFVRITKVSVLNKLARGKEGNIYFFLGKT